jgi:hypothetical protein
VKKWFNKKVGFLFYKKMTNLDSQGIGNSTKKLIVCSIKLISALTNLKHVCKTIIKEFGGKIFIGECLFIWKQQTFIDGGISLCSLVNGKVCRVLLSLSKSNWVLISTPDKKQVCEP